MAVSSHFTAMDTAMSLTKTQKKYLIGLCHHINPVVLTGQKGLTDNVLAEVDEALRVHELVKVKLRGEREERKQWAETIQSRLKAELVQLIGHNASFYRRNQDKPQLELPR